MSKKNIFLAISYTKRQKVEMAITNFFEDKGFKVITGRKIRSGKNQGDELIRIIKECEFGVVVFNELRHNVSYEYGLLDALIGETGHVFLFKDASLHINLDSELSDKKGINATNLYGEDREEEIIKSLEKNEGLMELIELCIGKSISEDQTDSVVEAAKAIISTDLPTKLIADFGIPANTPNADLENLKDKLARVTNLNVQGYFYKSVTHFYLNEFDQAEIEMRNVIKLDPKNATAYEDLGVILSKLERDEEAVTMIKTAITLDPTYHGYTNLGIILAKLREYNESETALKKAVSLDPNNALGYSLLGGILTNLQKFNEAETVLLKSLSLDPKLSMTHGILALLYITQKHYPEAEMKLKDELKLDPVSITALDVLGRLYIELKRYNEAKEVLNSALILDPKNESVIKSLDILSKLKDHPTNK